MAQLTRIEVGGSLPHPAEAVFDLLSDYSRVDAVIDGLEPLSPIGASSGVGARFAASITIAGHRHSVELELSEACRPVLVTWSGLGGEDRTITFHLARRQQATDLRIVASYLAPDGLSGALTRPLVATAVRQMAERTLRLLRQGDWLS